MITQKSQKTIALSSEINNGLKNDESQINNEEKLNEFQIKSEHCSLADGETSTFANNDLAVKKE